jgi:hypothetical protein
MEREDEAMQEGETGNAVEKHHDGRALVQALLICPPCLERAAGHVEYLGRLALGEPLGVQLAIAFTQIGTFEACPALVAIMIATVLFLAYRCHRLPPLPKPLPYAKWRAKDGEVSGPSKILRRNAILLKWSLLHSCSPA